MVMKLPSEKKAIRTSIPTVAAECRSYYLLGYVLLWRVYVTYHEVDREDD